MATMQSGVRERNRVASPSYRAARRAPPEIANAHISLPEPLLDQTQLNISVFWAFVAILAAAAALMILMPSPKDNERIGARYPFDNGA